MLVELDETFQLELDCVASVGGGLCVAYGWAVTPRGVGAELSVLAGPGTPCAIDHGSFHPRPELLRGASARATAVGFNLVFATPEDPPELLLTLGAETRALHADLRAALGKGDILQLTAERDSFVTFDFLRHTAATPAMAGLLRHAGRPFGIFDQWLDSIPVVQGLARKVGALPEVEVVSTPAGEVLVMLRSAAALPPEAEISTVVIAWLRGAEGAPPQPVLCDLADGHTAQLPAALAAYGRVDPALLDRLQAIEVIVQAKLGHDDAIWLRARPTQGAVPDLLDAAGRTAASSLAGPPAAPGLAFLRQIISRREAAFAPALAALATSAPSTPRMGPRLALILGAQDPGLAQLFHVNAASFERHCDTLLVLGEAADEIARVFEQRGRVTVRQGIDATQALREAAGRASVIALDATAFAEAVIAGHPDAAFGTTLGAADIARLLTLHAAACCAPDLADSLQRVLLLRDSGDAQIPPVPRAWSNRGTADLANAHLRHLWTVGRADASARPEHASHG